MFPSIFSSDVVIGFWIPFSLASAGLIGPCYFLEWMTDQEWAKKDFITYEEGKPRWKDLNKRHVAMENDRMTAASVRKSLVVAFACSIILYFLGLETFSSKEALLNVPSFRVMSMQFLVYYYFYDFLSFLIHYSFHEYDFLWKHCHAKHHREHTPSASSTAYADFWDSFLNGGIPHVVAISVIRPHAVVAYFCIFLICCTASYIHSGMQIDWLDQYFLFGWMPFRSTSRLHDYHHRFSGRKTTNVGTNLWIWDYLFGTLTAERA